MKKKYIKPSIIVLSLLSNEYLCTACQYDAEGSNKSDIIEDIYNDPDYINPFATDSGCASPVEGYCKHAPEGGSIIFNS